MHRRGATRVVPDMSSSPRTPRRRPYPPEVASVRTPSPPGPGVLCPAGSPRGIRPHPSNPPQVEHRRPHGLCSGRAASCPEMAPGARSAQLCGSQHALQFAGPLFAPCRPTAAPITTASARRDARPAPRRLGPRASSTASPGPIAAPPQMNRGDVAAPSDAPEFPWCAAPAGGPQQFSLSQCAHPSRLTPRLRATPQRNEKPSWAKWVTASFTCMGTSEAASTFHHTSRSAQSRPRRNRAASRLPASSGLGGTTKKPIGQRSDRLQAISTVKESSDRWTWNCT